MDGKLRLRGTPMSGGHFMGKKLAQNPISDLCRPSSNCPAQCQLQKYPRCCPHPIPLEQTWCPKLWTWGAVADGEGAAPFGGSCFWVQSYGPCSGKRVHMSSYPQKQLWAQGQRRELAPSPGREQQAPKRDISVRLTDQVAPRTCSYIGPLSQIPPSPG